MKIRHHSAVTLSLFPTIVLAATKTAIFADGTTRNSSYEHVSAGRTRYVECIRVQYDPKSEGCMAVGG